MGGGVWLLARSAEISVPVEDRAAAHRRADAGANENAAEDRQTARAMAECRSHASVPAATRRPSAIAQTTSD